MHYVRSHRLRWRQLANGISGATGQKNGGEAKADKFQHAHILLNTNADSSRFREAQSFATGFKHSARGSQTLVLRLQFDCRIHHHGLLGIQCH